MGRLAGGVVGAALGFAVGGPTGARFGFAGGQFLGGALAGSGGEQNNNRAAPPLAEFAPLNGNAGAPVDFGYGSNRHSGHVIWFGGYREIETTTPTGGGGGGGGKGGPGSGGGGSTETRRRRVATFAILWKELSISEVATAVGRVWIAGKLVIDPRAGLEPEAYLAGDRPFIYSTAQTFNTPGTSGPGVRHYMGGLDQLPDPAMEEALGAGNAPAYRGCVISVFDSFELEPYGNQMPYSFEAEVVTGTITDPPIRIREFETPTGSAAVRNARYLGNDTWQRAYYYGSDVDGNEVLDDHIYVTHVVETYNLYGQKIDVERTTRRSNYVDDITRLEAAPSGIRNAPYLGYTKISSGQQLNPSATSFWSFFLGQSGSNNPTVTAPGGVSPYSARGFLNGQTVDYTGALGGFTNSTLFLDGYVYGYNSGTDNQPGIARYKVSQPAWFPSGDPDSAFFDLRAGGYTVSGVDSQGGRARIFQGMDGYIYVAAFGNPDARFDNGVNVIRLTKDLEFVADIDIGEAHSNSAEFYFWNNLMVDSAEQTNDNARRLRLWDISDTGNPTLLNTANTNTELGSAEILPLPNGLFVMPDGIWSVREQVTAQAVTLQSALENLADRVGMDSSEIDASGATQSLRGFKVSGPTGARGAIESLFNAFPVIGFESQKELKFTTLGTSSIVTIPEDDLIEISDGEARTSLVRTRAQELELPRQIDFGFSDVNQDYQPDWQYSSIIETISEEKLRISVPVVFSSAEGAQRADQIKRQMWTERIAYQISLGPKYTYLDPGDVITLPTSQGNIDARIVKIHSGLNMEHRIDLVAEQNQNYTSDAVGNDPDSDNAQALSAPGPTKLLFIDSVPLRDTDTGPGYYLAASGYTAAWAGANVTLSDGTTETFLKTFVTQATCGFTTTALASADNGLDTINSVTVKMINDGVLGSITTDEWLDGGNAALIGNEIVYFRDVTDLGDGLYTIKTFFRGFLDTSTAGHAADDRFLLLEPDKIFNIDATTAQTDETLTFLARTFYESGRAPTEYQATLGNNRTKALAPAFGFAIRKPNGDYEGYFYAGGRAGGELESGHGHIEPMTTELYSVDCYTAEGVQLATVLTPTFAAYEKYDDYDGKKYFTYTFAQQQSDNGGFAVDEASFDCFQVDDNGVRGPALRIVSQFALAALGDYDQLILSQLPTPKFYWPLDVDRDDIDTPADALTGGGDFSFTTSTPVQGGTGSLFRSATSPSHAGQITGAKATANIDELCVSLWFRIYLTNGAIRHRPFLAQNNINNYVGRFAVGSKDGEHDKLHCRMRFNNNVRIICETDGTNKVNDNSWHHLVFQGSTFNGFDACQIWLDGVLEVTEPTTGIPANTRLQDTTTGIQLLGENADRTNYGYFAKIAFYDRLLSQSEIEAQYALRNF